MNKIRGVVLSTLAFIGSASLAHANYVLSYQIGAGPITNCANVASDTLATCFSAPTSVGSGVTFTQFTGTSNSPGTVASAMQTGSVVDITTTGAITIHLWLAAQDFTAPTVPPGFILDAASLTVIPTSGSGSVTLTDCVDKSNGTAPPTGVFCSTPALSLTNPTINYSGNTSQSNNASGTITTLGSPFSLSEEVTITIAAASELEIQTRQVLTAVPEPGTIVLLGSLLVVIATVFRKRVARQA